MIARGRVANKTAQDTYCLRCLAKHPKATFGERLKAYRVAAGLTRKELARRAQLPLRVIEYTTEASPAINNGRRPLAGTGAWRGWKD